MPSPRQDPSLRAASVVDPLRQSPARYFRPTRIGKVPAGTTIPEYYRIVFYTYIHIFDLHPYSMYFLESIDIDYYYAPSCSAVRPHHGSGSECLSLHLHVPAYSAGLVGSGGLFSLLLSPVAQSQVIVS